MKKHISTILICLMGTFTFAQAPSEMTYQSVVRNASGALVSNTNVGAQFSILQGSVNGTAVFVEWVTVLSNDNGLITHEIGSTTTMAIDWSNGPYFIKIEIDPAGGTSFTSSSTSQFLSVPYSLYSEVAESAIWADGADYTTLTNAPTNVSAFTNDAGYIASANTLDQAYDEGGAGLGRTITADAGSVLINNSGSNLTGLEVNSGVANSSAVLANQTSTGVAIRAESTNPSNGFSTIQASTNSSVAVNSAIIGSNSGAGYGVTGQLPPTSTGDAGVYGNNLRTNGGYGVLGIGFNGVVGQSAYGDGFAVYGSNTGATGLGIGTYGIGFNGVYGQTTNVTTGWSGYFTADIGVAGTGYALGGWVNASDERLKTNIVAIESPLEKLSQLNGRHYTITYKTKKPDGEVETHSRLQYGVIAQEVESVFPEMVKEKSIFSNAGDDTVYKTVEYTQLIPVLLESIKELNLKVESLELELENLK